MARKDQEEDKEKKENVYDLVKEENLLHFMSHFFGIGFSDKHSQQDLLLSK